MHITSPRWESTHYWNGEPWPPQHDDPPEDHHVLKIVLSVLYSVGFLISSVYAACAVPTAGLREKPWIPPFARSDACLAPVFFILPAVLWPLVPPLSLVYFFLKGVAYLVWGLVRDATTCCGVPLSRLPRFLRVPQLLASRLLRRWVGGDQDVEAADSSAPDLEMAPVVAGAEDDVASEPDGGKDDSTPAGERSAGSGESELPPAYTSLSPKEDEDDSGETDGLLPKRTSE